MRGGHYTACVRVANPTTYTQSPNLTHNLTTSTHNLNSNNTPNLSHATNLNNTPNSTHLPNSNINLNSALSQFLSLTDSPNFTHTSNLTHSQPQIDQNSNNSQDHNSTSALQHNLTNTYTDSPNLSNFPRTANHNDNHHKASLQKYLSSSFIRSPFINHYMPKRRRFKRMVEKYGRLKKLNVSALTNVITPLPNQLSSSTNNTSQNENQLPTITTPQNITHNNILSTFISTQIEKISATLNPFTTISPTNATTTSHTKATTTSSTKAITTSSTIDPGVWYLADDSRVSRLSSVEAVLKRQAYLLFYERIQ